MLPGGLKRPARAGNHCPVLLKALSPEKGHQKLPENLLKVPVLGHRLPPLPRPTEPETRGEAAIFILTNLPGALQAKPAQVYGKHGPSPSEWNSPRSKTQVLYVGATPGGSLYTAQVAGWSPEL